MNVAHVSTKMLLSIVDSTAGKRLRDLVALRPASHYGTHLLTAKDRLKALRAASALVEAAQVRTT